MIKVHAKSIRTIPDADADSSYLHQEGFGDRLDAFLRGDFDFVGIMAVADVTIIVGGSEHIIHQITTPGIWGVESDSDPSYLAELAAEEMRHLERILDAMAEGRQ